MPEGKQEALYFFASFVPLLFIHEQVLLDKHASSLESAEDTGRRKVLTVFSVLRGIVMFLTMGAGAVYAILALVEEELAYQFGSARILLVGSLVRVDPRLKIRGKLVLSGAFKKKEEESA